MSDARELGLENANFRLKMKIESLTQQLAERTEDAEDNFSLLLACKRELEEAQLELRNARLKNDSLDAEKGAEVHLKVKAFEQVRAKDAELSTLREYNKILEAQASELKEQIIRLSFPPTNEQE